MTVTAEANWGELSSVMSAHGRAYLRARDHFLACHPELVHEVAASGLRLHGGRLPRYMTEEELRVRATQTLARLLDALRLHGADIPIGWDVRDPGDMAARTSIAPAHATVLDEASSGSHDAFRLLARSAAPAVSRSLEASENTSVSSPSKHDDADRADRMILGAGHISMSSVEAGALREEFLARVIAAPAPGQDVGSLLRLAEQWLTAGSSKSRFEAKPDLAYDMGFDGVSEMADAIQMVKEGAASAVRACTRLVA